MAPRLRNEKRLVLALNLSMVARVGVAVSGMIGSIAWLEGRCFSLGV